MIVRRIIHGQVLVARRDGQRLRVAYSDRTVDRLKCSSAHVAKRLEAYLLNEPTTLDASPRGFVRRMVQLIDASQHQARRRCGR